MKLPDRFSFFQPFVKCLVTRDLVGDAERCSPPVSRKARKMLTNIIIRDAIERIQ